MLEYSTTIVWHCDAPGCKVTEGRSTLMSEVSEPVKPCFPVTWARVGYLHYCPKHAVRVMIGSREVARFPR